MVKIKTSGFKLDDEIKEGLQLFVDFIIEKLKIKSEPSIILSDVENKDKYGIVTSALVELSTNEVRLIAKNRMFLDVIRSIAHEFVHIKQNEQNRVKSDTPDVGGQIEDEANSLAGVYVKLFIYKLNGNDVIYKVV